MTNFFTFGKRLLVATALITASVSIEPAKASETLTFGIVPQQSATRLARMWGPIINYVKETTGVTIRFSTTKDIPTFEACLAEKAYDLAYMNPYHYVVFSSLSGYDAFAKQADKRLRGILVARADAPIESLEDLEGSDIAFPSPAAFGASVLPRGELSANGVAFNPKYVKSHDSVYRAVAAGLTKAGGGVLRTWNAADPEIKKQLRVFHTTESYTPHAFAFSKTVSKDVQLAIKAAFIRVVVDDPEAVQSIGMSGIIPAADHDWNDVRSLDLSKGQTSIVTESKTKCPSA